MLHDVPSVADAYAPPRSEIGHPTFPSSAVARLRHRSLAVIGISLLFLVAGCIAAAAIDSNHVVLAVGLATAAIALYGAGAGFVALVRSFRTAPSVTKGAIALTLFAIVSNLGMSLVGLFVAWLSTWTFTRGRQLRRFGKILLPPVSASTPANDWTNPLVDAAEIDFDDVLRDEGVDAETRAALAAQWRENGRTEHASVAAFARLTLDLVALGAPPALVAGAQRDALDEIRHAELCFALARAIDGKNESPSSFPEASRARRLSRIRNVALAELAVDSLVDGALHEGVSARIVAKLARRTADPSIRAILKQIAADEGRHSAHGWDVVKFCLAEGGAPVAHALASAAGVLPKTMTSPLPADAAAGGWERWGIMGSALEASEYDKARASVVRRLSDLIAPYGIAVAA
jgi:hypothetical protein